MQYLPDDILKGYARGMFSYTPYITHTKYITNQDIIDSRLKIIQFAEKYGIPAAIEAFDVSRATIYNWKRRVRPHLAPTHRMVYPNLDALAPHSRRPKRFRKSKVASWYSEQILSLREQRSNIGKSKIKPLLDQLCEKEHRPTISESTVGRILNRLKQSGTLPKQERVSFHARSGRITKHQDNQPKRITKRRRNGYMPKEPGDLVQIDCVIKFYNGLKRYIISGIDYKTSFAYSYAYPSLSSRVSTDFLHKFQQVAPFKIKHIQTDNGSEFMARFHEELEAQGLTHFFNYPRHPKSNGKIERYNRTIQEEFIDAHIEDLAYDLQSFNEQLADWLLYYNTERPHFSHREPGNPTIQIPPMRALIYVLQLKQWESNMLWTHTSF